MRTGRPLKPLTLRAEEEEKLGMLARRRKIAEQLGITGATAGKWRRRFLEARLDGLWDEPRAGAPRQITDAQVEEAVTRTLESTAVAAIHLSTRTLAQELACRNAPWYESGTLSGCSRTAARTSNCPRILSFWRRYGISWACT
jgi:transposase